MDNKELNHAGIKGMKWGRRRWQNKDGSLTPEGRVRYADHEDSYKARTAKPASAMSDKELLDAINRKRNEDTYNQMFAPKKSAGRKWTEDLLKHVGTELAKDYTKKAAQGAINMGIDALGVKYKDNSFGKILKNMNLMSKDVVKDLSGDKKDVKKDVKHTDETDAKKVSDDIMRKHNIDPTTLKSTKKIKTK